MTTIRQEMIRLLEEDPRDARELSQILGIKEKEVYEHLAHVAKSVKAQKKKLTVLPFSCLTCGFVFENRRRFTRPGKCPRCRDSRVEYPLYKIG
ncbi:MAG: ArsR family transcriptional regulator [Desulfobacterales bacterium]|nr:ArsR family transcriptional regulator [Desulfobacterales bacterium]